MGRRREGLAARGTGARCRRGFTIVEIALATTVLMIALMSASAATLRMHSLRQQNRERMVAQNALRSVAERVHSRSAAASDDIETWAQDVIAAFTAGGEAGDTFEVPELTPLPGQPVGRIWVISNETATDAALGFDLGLPRDLDGDGLATDTDVSDGARILPVLLSVRWRGKSGISRMDHAFYVLGY